MRTNLFLFLIFTQSLLAVLQAQTPGVTIHGAKMTINNGTYVVITGEAGNFTVESGEVYLYGKIILSGNLVNNTANPDLFNAVDNNHTDLVFTGTQDQVIGGGNTLNVVCQNLTVNPGSKAVLHAGKKLNVLGDLTNNGTITIGADENEQSTLKITGAVSGSGTFNVETHVTSGRNWYLSSPVSGAKSSVFNAAANSISWYDESKGSTTPWTDITDNTTNLVPFRGYIATVPTDGNVTFTGGTLNNSTETITLYRTAGQAKEGFNLVGNPFPAYYDFGSSTKTHIQPSFWYRAKNAGNTAYVFDTYSVTNGLGTSLSSKSVTTNIPPMQAFWVRVDNGFSSGTITFDKQYINHKDVTNNRRRAKEATNAKFVRLQVSNGTNFDEAIVVFNPLASDGYDAYDSPKMSNGSTKIPEIFTKAGNEVVAINGMKTFDSERIIPLGFSTGQTASFTLKATEISGFDSSFRLILVDKNKPAEYDITEGIDYAFNSSVVNSTDRFELKFKVSGQTTATENAISDGINFIRKDNNHIWVTYSGIVEKGSLVTLYNTAGQAISNKLIESENTELTLPTTPGVYMLKAIVSGKAKTSKVILN